MTDDLFRHTCRKQCIVPSSDETEIFEAETAELENLEEEAVAEASSIDPCDIKAWSQELECMLRRIQFLQLRLKSKMPTCKEDQPCVDLAVELSCSENKEICDLQKNLSKLQYQIQELIRCCCYSKEQIKELRSRMCEKSKDIAQLQRMVGLLESWRRTLDNEFGVCLERFNYLKHVKAEWKDVLEKIEKRKECWHKMEQLYVSKSCYEQHKNKVQEETDDLRLIFKNLCILQMERYTDMNERMELMEERLKKAEEAAKSNESCEKEKKPAVPNENYDFAAALVSKEQYESTVPVHKIYLGQKELYPKSCEK